MHCGDHNLHHALVAVGQRSVKFVGFVALPLHTERNPGDKILPVHLLAVALFDVCFYCKLPVFGLLDRLVGGDRYKVNGGAHGLRQRFAKLLPQFVFDVVCVAAQIQRPAELAVQLKVIRLKSCGIRAQVIANVVAFLFFSL